MKSEDPIKNTESQPEKKAENQTAKKPENQPAKKVGDMAQEQMEKNLKQSDLKRRLTEVRATRWIRFGIVSIIFLLLVMWIGSPWLLLVWLLLFDIYITGYIPFTFWKKSKNKFFRTVMSWIDAIVYALVLVYLIFVFVGQNYKIPSSSLEKTLLVGDYLWVNKMVYGPRVPETPLHFPLAQHTMPFFNSKSYIENPQLKYRRLQGLRDVERGDIVVFNYPQGDTVVMNMPDRDYYLILLSLQYDNDRYADIKTLEDARAFVRNNPEYFGEIVRRPVDRRENYVKRAIGLPGDRLSIKDDIVYINGKAIENPGNMQHNFIVPVAGPIPDYIWEELGVSISDRGPLRETEEGTKYYDVPLTADAKAALEKTSHVKGKLKPESEVMELNTDIGIFPLGNPYAWGRNNMGEIWIPKKGTTLHLTSKNLPLYSRAIQVYEGNDLKVTEDGKIFINGKETEYYTFKLDYYWMMGDNRDNSADSRYWGFVPEDHVVGTPMFIIASFDQDKSLLGGIRWNRFFRVANPDK